MRMTLPASTVNQLPPVLKYCLALNCRVPGKDFVVLFVLRSTPWTSRVVFASTARLKSAPPGPKTTKLEPMTCVTGVPEVPPATRMPPPLERVNVLKPAALTVTGLVELIRTPVAERVSKAVLPVAALPEAARRMTSDAEPVTLAVLMFVY